MSDYPNTIQLQTGGFPSTSGGQILLAQPAPTTNTVVLTQPVAQRRNVRKWGTKMSACCSDMEVCFCVVLCGCYSSVKLSQDLGEHCCVPCFVPFWLGFLRTKLRIRHNIEGSVLEDCWKTTFCGMCTQCQMMREIKALQKAGIPLA